MNVSLDEFIEDIKHLRRLQNYENKLLPFSYYSGFIIAVFNFIIFILSITLYIRVSKTIKTSIEFFFQNSSRRLSLLFISNLALADIILPLVTSLSTPTRHVSDNTKISDHLQRSTTCRLSQSVFTTIMANALLALGLFLQRRHLKV